MTDTETSAGVIERLEKATGPNRSLDLQIHRAINGKPIEYETWWIAHDDVLWKNGDRTDVSKWPWYTESIDAALMLVPEGWQVAIFHQNRDGSWFCALHNNDTANQTHSHFPFEDKTKLTAAIALCIAALKARSTP